jgi:hypothetical protein
MFTAVLPAGADPTPGPAYIATDNVEWVANIPLNTDSAGARLLGKQLFVTDDRGLTIWDVEDPAFPKPLSYTPAPQGAYYVEEDVDTNGKILLLGTFSDLTDGLGGPLNKLQVYDVSNRTAPKLIGELPGANSHTVTCVLDCTYAYNSNGRIIDLTDPTKPKFTGTRWDAAANSKGGHDLTEVAPGLVVTSSRPILYLDAREDPAKPKVIGTGTPGDNRLVHGNLWPQNGKDKYLLVGGESGGNCNTKDAGAFMTFTHSRDEVTGQTTFRMVDEFRLGTGLPTDGNSPYDQYCAHWFSTHPDYADGGLVAAGWYEHGTRFLNVDHKTGQISEAGWFYPVGGSTSAAYWIDDQYLYVVDYQRGIDILRYTGKPAAGTKKVDGVVAAPRVPSLARQRIAQAQMGSERYVCPLPGS